MLLKRWVCVCVWEREEREIERESKRASEREKSGTMSDTEWESSQCLLSLNIRYVVFLYFTHDPCEGFLCVTSSNWDPHFPVYFSIYSWVRIDQYGTHMRPDLEGRSSIAAVLLYKVFSICGNRWPQSEPSSSTLSSLSVPSVYFPYCCPCLLRLPQTHH